MDSYTAPPRPGGKDPGGENYHHERAREILGQIEADRSCCDQDPTQPEERSRLRE